MKTSIKTIILAVIAFVLSATEASAQKISTVAVADQHYAAQTANYKLMMIALAAVYGVYVMLQMRRKRQINRFMGNI